VSGFFLDALAFPFALALPFLALPFLALPFVFLPFDLAFDFEALALAFLTAARATSLALLFMSMPRPCAPHVDCSAYELPTTDSPACEIP